jgi:uncharacterized coiled-coil DUF342 family protein
MSKVSPLFLVVVLCCSAGMYGCTQQKNGAAGAKLRDLETRFAKLEEDYRTIAASAEATRKKLNRIEAEKNELTKEVEELRPIVPERDELRKERDDLRKQLVTRTGERDNAQAQLTQFRQDLHDLITRVDAALNNAPAAHGTPIAAVPVSHKPE